MIIEKSHSFVVDEEISDFSSKTDVKGILLDIKFIMQEYYIGNFSTTGDSLIIQLNNGQVFEISVKEISDIAN